jgi:hypothetical protein
MNLRLLKAWAPWISIVLLVLGAVAMHLLQTQAVATKLDGVADDVRTIKTAIIGKGLAERSP